jgi:hypothetical protein
MRGLLSAIVLSLLVTEPTLAAESWVEVSTSARERILVDQNSIQRDQSDQNEVRYWEYRDVRPVQAVTGELPYGMMIYRSVNCASQQGRVQRLVLFNQNRDVIRRVNYGEKGNSLQPITGSSTEATVRYVCGQ